MCHHMVAVSSGGVAENGDPRQLRSGPQGANPCKIRQSTTLGRLCPAGIKGDSPSQSQQQGRQPPPMQQQQQHSQSARWRGRPSGESSSTTGAPGSTPQHHAPAPTHSYSSFSSGLPRPLELPPLPLKLPPKHLYTCTVGRNRSQAR